MPSIRKIPARTEVVCHPCPHHKMVAAMYGHDYSWQDYSCMHPDAYDDKEPLSDPEKEKHRQRMIGAMAKDGRHIGKTDLRPDWCPLNPLHPSNQQPKKEQ